MKKMISRRNFLAAAGVVAAAGVLTACGGSSNSTAASASTAASGAAASGDTIKVGVLGPLTGDVSVYGQAVVNGATLYLKQVNEKGGINGKQLEIDLAVLPGLRFAAGARPTGAERKRLCRSLQSQRTLSGQRRAPQPENTAAHGHVCAAGVRTGRYGDRVQPYRPPALCAGGAGERPDRRLCGQ